MMIDNPFTGHVVAWIGIRDGFIDLDIDVQTMTFLVNQR